MADDSEFFRKKPQQSRSRSVVNALFEAADQLLERSGDPKQVSLQGIAQRAGVGIGSLYDYFANREGLLGAFLSRLTEKNFEELERQVLGTRTMKFDEALPLILDSVLRTYLDKPARTRAVIHAIAMTGWVKPVVAERDRFALLLAQRLHIEHPEIDFEALKLTSEVLCDAVMGVVQAELWREPSSSERTERVRNELVELARLRIAKLLSPN